MQYTLSRYTHSAASSVCKRRSATLSARLATYHIRLEAFPLADQPAQPFTPAAISIPIPIPIPVAEDTRAALALDPAARVHEVLLDVVVHLAQVDARVRHEVAAAVGDGVEARRRRLAGEQARDGELDEVELDRRVERDHGFWDVSVNSTTAHRVACGRLRAQDKATGRDRRVPTVEVQAEGLAARALVLGLRGEDVNVRILRGLVRAKGVRGAR